MTQIDNNTVLEFIRLLLQYTKYSMDETRGTILNEEGKECTIEDPIDRQVMPIRIVRPNMVYDRTFTDLNPFVVLEGVQPATDWFYATRIMGLSVWIKKTLVACVKTGVEGKSEEYDKLGFISGLSEKFDAQMVSEIEKINAADVFKIFYNKSTKTAEAQTELFTEELEKRHKFRKKTWTTVRALFLKLLGIEKEEDMARFTYKTSVLRIPDIDAKLHVFGAILNVVGKVIEQFTGADMHVKEFMKHLDNVEGYGKLYSWVTTAVSKNGTTASKPSWNEIPVSPNRVPTGQPIPISSGSKPAEMPSTAPAKPEAMPQTAAPHMSQPGMMPTSQPAYYPTSGYGYGAYGSMPPAYQPKTFPIPPDAYIPIVRR